MKSSCEFSPDSKIIIEEIIYNSSGKAYISPYEYQLIEAYKSFNLYKKFKEKFLSSDDPNPLIRLFCHISKLNPRQKKNLIDTLQRIKNTENKDIYRQLIDRYSPNEEMDINSLFEKLFCHVIPGSIGNRALREGFIYPKVMFNLQLLRSEIVNILIEVGLEAEIIISSQAMLDLMSPVQLQEVERVLLENFERFSTVSSRTDEVIKIAFTKMLKNEFSELKDLLSENDEYFKDNLCKILETFIKFRRIEMINYTLDKILNDRAFNYLYDKLFKSIFEAFARADFEIAKLFLEPEVWRIFRLEEQIQLIRIMIIRADQTTVNSFMEYLIEKEIFNIAIFTNIYEEPSTLKTNKVYKPQLCGEIEISEIIEAHHIEISIKLEKFHELITEKFIVGMLSINDLSNPEQRQEIFVQICGIVSFTRHFNRRKVEAVFKDKFESMEPFILDFIRVEPQYRIKAKSDGKYTVFVQLIEHLKVVKKELEDKKNGIIHDELPPVENVIKQEAKKAKKSKKVKTKKTESKIPLLPSSEEKLPEDESISSNGDDRGDDYPKKEEEKADSSAIIEIDLGIDGSYHDDFLQDQPQTLITSNGDDHPDNENQKVEIIQAQRETTFKNFALVEEPIEEFISTPTNDSLPADIDELEIVAFAKVLEEETNSQAPIHPTQVLLPSETVMFPSHQMFLKKYLATVSTQILVSNSGKYVYQLVIQNNDLSISSFTINLTSDEVLSPDEYRSLEPSEIPTNNTEVILGIASYGYINYESYKITVYDQQYQSLFSYIITPYTRLSAGSFQVEWRKTNVVIYSRIYSQGEPLPASAEELTAQSEPPESQSREESKTHSNLSNDSILSDFSVILSSFREKKFSNETEFNLNHNIDNSELEDLSQNKDAKESKENKASIEEQMENRDKIRIVIDETNKVNVTFFDPEVQAFYDNFYKQEGLDIYSSFSFVGYASI